MVNKHTLKYHFKQSIFGGLSDMQAQAYIYYVFRQKNRDLAINQDLMLALAELESRLKKFIVQSFGGTLMLAILIPLVLKVIGVI
jgi:hypothetical protein